MKGRKLVLLVVILLAIFTLFWILPIVWAGPTSRGTVPGPTPTPSPVPTLVPLPEDWEDTLPMKCIGATSLGCIPYTCDDLWGLDLDCAFHWGPSAPNCDGIKRIVMIREISHISADLSAFDIALTYNEPNVPNGILHPTIAAIEWHHIEMEHPHLLLISPAIGLIHLPNCPWKETMPDATCNWLEDFISEYVKYFGRLPRIDGLGGHCYSGYGEELVDVCREMVEYLETFIEPLDIRMGIWINEFAPNMWLPYDRMHQQLKDALFYLNTNDNVVMYGVWNLRTKIWERQNTFWCESRNLTKYGEIYRDARVYDIMLPVITK